MHDTLLLALNDATKKTNGYFFLNSLGQTLILIFDRKALRIGYSQPTTMQVRMYTMKTVYAMFSVTHLAPVESESRVLHT
jgi:hypothetical protein